MTAASLGCMVVLPINFSGCMYKLQKCICNALVSCLLCLWTYAAEMNQDMNRKGLVQATKCALNGRLWLRPLCKPPYQLSTQFHDCTHVRLSTHFRLIMAASMACQAVARGLRGASASCLFLNKNKVMLTICFVHIITAVCTRKSDWPSMSVTLINPTASCAKFHFRRVHFESSTHRQIEVSC